VLARAPEFAGDRPFAEQHAVAARFLGALVKTEADLTRARGQLGVAAPGAAARGA
jgi:hypothetical protein